MKGKLNRVTPEMCTKEELVAYVRECVKLWHCGGMAYLNETLDFFIRRRRSLEICKELSVVETDLENAEKYYNKILKPYRKEMSDPDHMHMVILPEKEMPEHIYLEALRLFNKIRRLKNEAKKLHEKLDKI